jgi:ABC-2 type transport system ATP-binding protein
MTNGHAVEAQDLRKSFGDFKAVQGVSFAVDTSEVLSLLGPNGAGKSTIISMLSGLLPPTEGRRADHGPLDPPRPGGG